jgi:hypothetical protein
MINDIFCQLDAQQILAMPLREGMEDLWAWFYEPKVLFTVKSAYKLHCELLRISSPNYNGETSTDQRLFDWYSIWNSPCPPNIKKISGEWHTTAYR